MTDLPVPENPDGLVWIAGKKMYAVCVNCDRIVRVNKPLLGDLHVCTERER